MIMSTFKRTAFTLIELLVVIVIIGILSSLILVSIGNVNNKVNIARGQAFADSSKNYLGSHLVSDWKLDGNAADKWGVNNGSIVGSATILSGNDCVQGSCINFDGIDDYLNMGSNPSLNFSADYTIEMFVYNGAGSLSYPTLISRAGQSKTNGYFWIFTQGTNEVDIRGQWSNGSVISNYYFYNVLPKDKWTHLAFNFTNSNKVLNLYVNGVKNSNPVTLTGALPVDDSTLYFGSYTGNVSSYAFKGRMDEIQWYNDNLSSHIIKEHYYSALNKLFIKEKISKEEYFSFISQENNKYGKY